MRYVRGIRMSFTHKIWLTVVVTCALGNVGCSKGSGEINIGGGGNVGGSGVGAGTGSLGALTVSAVSPPAGDSGGATLITITGTGFASGDTVTVGGTACTPVTVVSSTQITCTTAATSAGSAGSVVVTDPANPTTPGSMATAFAYQSTPTVSGISPAGGALAGGTAVTITGVALSPSSTILIGGQPCTPVVVNATQTSATCTTASASAGADDVVVSTPGGGSTSLAGAFIYSPAPTITSVSPITGTTAGGTTLTVNGTGFRNSPTLPTILLASTSCGSVAFVSASQITCVTPAATFGAVAVRVTNSDGQFASSAGAFTYQAPAPTISAVSLAGGPIAGGATITITGTGFLSAPSNPTVTVGGGSCGSLVYTSSTQVTCVTPAHGAGLVNVVLTNADSQIATATGAYTYRVAPTFTSVTPSAGALAGGTSIVIVGTGFINVGAVPTVLLGGTACTSVVFNSATQLTCTTPAKSAGTVNLTVTNSDAQAVTANNAYTYQAAPTFTSVSPVSGGAIGGNTLTIAGTNFRTVPSNPTVTVGGTSCPVLTASATLVTCTAPAHTAGSAAILVTNYDNQAVTANGAYSFRSLMFIAQVGASTTFDSAFLNPSSGVLTAATAAAPASDALAIAVHATLNLVYVFRGANIDLYSINAATGALTNQSATLASGLITSTVSSLTMHPTGKWLYATAGSTTGNSKILPITIDQTTGAMTAGTAVQGMQGATVQTSPVQFTISPDGKWGYAVMFGTSRLCGFAINQSTGALTQIGANCTDTAANTTGAAIDATSAHIYAVGSGSGNVSMHTISGADGSLGAAAATTLTGSASGANVVTVSGGILYVATNNSKISSYTINSDGTLTGSTNTNVTGVTTPDIEGIAVDPSGQFLYVSDFNNDSIILLTIGSAGALTQGGSPLTDTNISTPKGIAFTGK